MQIVPTIITVGYVYPLFIARVCYAHEKRVRALIPLFLSLSQFANCFVSTEFPCTSTRSHIYLSTLLYNFLCSSTNFLKVLGRHICLRPSFNQSYFMAIFNTQSPHKQQYHHQSHLTSKTVYIALVVPLSTRLAVSPTATLTKRMLAAAATIVRKSGGDSNIKAGGSIGSGNNREAASRGSFWR